MNNYIKKLLQGIGLLLVLLSSLVWAQTVNLNSHVSTTGGPTASSDIYIRWYTVNNPTPQTTETAGANNFVGESVSTALPLTAVNVTATSTPKNYYVFYYDKANNCLSTNYGKVTVITNACPTKTVSLSNITVSGPGTGSELQWHTVSSGFVQSGPGQTLVNTPSAVNPGTYYPVFYDSANNCYSPTGSPVIVVGTYCPRYQSQSFGMGGNTCANGFTAYLGVTPIEDIPANDATNPLKVVIDLPLAYVDETKPVTPKVMYGLVDISSQFTISTNLTTGKVTFTLNPTHDEFLTIENGGEALAFSYVATADATVTNLTANGLIYEGATLVQTDVLNTVKIELVPCACYASPTDTTTAVESKHGITLLKRAGTDNGDWPMIRNSGHTVLESNSKGFVITRMTTVEIEGQASPAIPSKITNPVVGMMVYDKDAKCLKIYTGPAAAEGWKCFSAPACPD